MQDPIQLARLLVDVSRLVVVLVALLAFAPDIYKATTCALRRSQGSLPLPYERLNTSSRYIWYEC